MYAMSDESTAQHTCLDAVSGGPSSLSLWLRVRAGGFVLVEAE